MLPWILNLGMTGDGGTTVAQTTPVSVAVTVNAGSVVSATTVAQAAAIAVAITVNAGSVDASTIVAQTTPVAVAVTVNAGTVSSSKLIEQTAPVAVAVTALGGDVTLGSADTAATGGWGSYSPQYERETSEERKTRIRKEREDLGIIEVPSLPAKAKPARDDKGRFKRRLELSEAERTRLLNELEAMAQADRQNRQKAALLLLLL